MPAQTLIVLAIDGLRASALGSYGTAWRSTPALDAFAAESTLIEWAYACRQGMDGVYTDGMTAGGPWEQSLLVTDEPSLAERAGPLGFTDAAQIESREVDRPAESMGDTALAESFGAFADYLSPEHLAAEAPARLVWFHSRGFTGPWDAPTELVNELAEEDDPTPEVSTAPPSGSINRAAEPDAMFQAVCRYSAQTVVLDACIESWLALLDEFTGGAPPPVVILGARGYALGEHGVIGLDETGPYSESRHVPVLVRPAGPRSPGQIGTRFASKLFNVQRLPDLLAKLSGELGDSTEEAVSLPTSDDLILEGTPRRAVRTREWLFVEPSESAGAPELYAKPDDRWEANDVASIQPNIVEQFGESSATSDDSTEADR